MASSSARLVGCDDLPDLSPEEMISNSPCNVCNRLIADWKHVQCTFVTPSMAMYSCECTNYAHWDCLNTCERRSWCCSRCIDQFVSEFGLEYYVRKILRRGGCEDRYHPNMTCRTAAQIERTHARKRKTLGGEPDRKRMATVSVSTQTDSV